MPPIVSLIVIVSAVLLCQTMTVIALQKDGTLIYHPEPKRMLLKDDILRKLEKIDVNQESKDRTAEAVAYLLYLANSKETTELIDGITVLELLEQNTFQPVADCSKEAFEKRADIAKETMLAAGGARKGAAYAVTTYLMRCLVLAARECIPDEREVFGQKVKDEQWLSELNLIADHAEDDEILNEWISQLTH